MSLDDLVQNLDHTSKTFRRIIQDNNYLKISPDILSWKDYLPGINHGLYIRQFEELINTRQFSFLFIDSSFAQIFYEYDETNLLKYRLSYYPAPVIRKMPIEEIEGYFDEASNDLHLTYYNILYDTYGQEILFSNENHIRFEYDSAVTAHMKSHIQFTGINDIRIPVKCLMLPSTFIDFVSRNIFPAEHAIIRTKPSYSFLKGSGRKNYQVIEELRDNDSFFIENALQSYQAEEQG